MRTRSPQPYFAGAGLFAADVADVTNAEPRCGVAGDAGIPREVVGRGGHQAPDAIHPHAGDVFVRLQPVSLEDFRRPERWGLHPDGGVARALPIAAQGHVLVAGNTSEGTAMFLAANGCTVTAIGTGRWTRETATVMMVSTMSATKTVI